MGKKISIWFLKQWCFTLFAGIRACYSQTAKYTPSRTPKPTTAAQYSTSYSCTGYMEYFTVPTGVTSLTITAAGAQGGSANQGVGGLGAFLSGTFTVAPRNVLSILVGCTPTGGAYAGGGGGSFVALGTPYSVSTPMIVAGGGGGGNGAGNAGQGGQITTSGGGPNPGTNGHGAPASNCGGGGGGFYTSGSNSNKAYGANGGVTVGFGGTGFYSGGAAIQGSAQGLQWGGYGGGAPPDNVGQCLVYAGAGGGYSGGSGFDSLSTQSSGYGGGSINNAPLSTQSNFPNEWSGNGQVLIGWATAPSTKSSSSHETGNIQAILFQIVSCAIICLLITLRF